MNTHRLVSLFVLLILSVFCLHPFSWAEGMIVYAYRGTTYMMHPNDTIPTRISEEGISTPSPDGRLLAAVDRDPDRRNLLHIRDLHTGKKIRSIILQVHSYVDISWSPDGRWIVYAGNIERLRAGRDLGTEIFLISPDGRQKRKLRHPIGERPIGFVWAPDAQSVFYNLAATDRRQEIWESKINGQENPKKHLPFHEAASFLNRYPFYSFSPNGKEIAYTPVHEGVFVTDVDGKNHRKVTDRGHENLFRNAVGVDIQAFVNHRLQQFFQVDWSPNGKQLVFSAETLAGTYGLYIYSFATQEARRLVLLRDSLPISPRWIGDSLPVQPLNKIAVTWGSLKRPTETD